MLYTVLQFLPRREHRSPLLQRPIGQCCLGKQSLLTVLRKVIYMYIYKYIATTCVELISHNRTFRFRSFSSYVLGVRSICQTTIRNALRHTSQNDTINIQKPSTQFCCSSVYSSTRSVDIHYCMHTSVCLDPLSEIHLPADHKSYKHSPRLNTN